MNLQANLAAIGFTEYEAKVYLALLRDSPTTGYQLSKKAGVPRAPRAWAWLTAASI